MKTLVSTQVTLLQCTLLVGCDRFTSDTESVSVDEPTGLRTGDVTAVIVPAGEREQIRSHDFGIVHPNSQLEHVFEVENHSGHALSVRKIDVDCACTVMRRPVEEVRPGEILNLPMSLKAPPNLSDIRKSVLVLFNEDVPPVRCYVTAAVRPHLHVTPSRVDVEFGSKVSLPFIRVMTYFGDKVDSLSVDFTDSRFTGTSEELAVDVGSDVVQAWRVKLQLKEPSSIPVTSTTVSEQVNFRTITSGIESEENAVLNILIKPEPDMKPDRTVLQFGASTSTGSVDRSFTVYSSREILPDNVRVSVVNASTNTPAESPWLTKVILAKDSHSANVVVTFNAAALASGFYKAIIEVSQETGKNAPHVTPPARVLVDANVP